jgi:serine/threonine protein kinase
MGVTYKALDVELRRTVTLKVISEKYLGDAPARLRFLREARSAASIRHPNVASVFHLGKTGSSYFYAMEFVEGETLEKFIKRSGCLEVNVALEIVTQVAAGLAAIHKQKLVHRDIKPSNIMVSLEDEGAVTAKIIDLGLAKPLDEPGIQTAISTPGALAEQGARAELVDLSEFPTRMSLAMAFEDGGRRLELRRPGGGTLDLDSVRAVWWRRPQAFRLPAEIGAPAFRAIGGGNRL